MALRCLNDYNFTFPGLKFFPVVLKVKASILQYLSGPCRSMLGVMMSYQAVAGSICISSD